MRISDWSSDVCSSDLFACSGWRNTLPSFGALPPASHMRAVLGSADSLASLRPQSVATRSVIGKPSSAKRIAGCSHSPRGRDRKSVVEGQSVSVCVRLGGGRLVKKKNEPTHVKH